MVLEKKVSVNAMIIHNHYTLGNPRLSTEKLLHILREFKKMSGHKSRYIYI